MPASTSICPSRFSPFIADAWDLNGQSLPPDAQGNLVVNAPGYSPLMSPPLSPIALGSIGTELTLDVFVPDDPGYASWAGDVQLFVSVPMQNNFQGIRLLSPLARGQTHRLTFPLASDVQTALLTTNQPVTFTIAVNRPAAAEPIRISDMEFTGVLTPRMPSCADGVHNGLETDVDCGGSCGGCALGDACNENTDCAAGECFDPETVPPGEPVDEEDSPNLERVCHETGAPSSCSVSVATDLGADGNAVTVAGNGCLRVRDAYPSWWDTRSMLVQLVGSASFPLPFTWINTCANAGGSAAFTHDWQTLGIGPTDENCATLINLMGAGTDNVTLRYYGP
jgi:hypothetical protein